MTLSLLMVFGLMTTNDAGSSDLPCHYYYFDQKRPLRLQADSIAIYHPGRPTAHLQDALRSGHSVKSVAERVVSDWSLVTLEPAHRDANGVARVMGEFSNLVDDSFLSPVFVGNEGGPVHVTPHLLVGFKAGVPADVAERIISEWAPSRHLERNFGGMKGAYRMRSTARDGFAVLRAANALAQRPEVEYAEPDMMFTGRGSVIPNDPGFGNCWGLHQGSDMDMDAPEAWDITTGASSIIVVIIDTGVQQNHPDIHQLTPGVDTTTDAGNGGPVNACDNHGTPVAGCVSATINNALGTVGIAPGCRSASARSFISNLDCTGSWTGQASWTVNSLAWADSIGARVSNNSNYYGFTSGAIESAYINARDGGMVHFASAGNDASSTITYPSSLPSVNAVAALNSLGNLASFSNFGVGLAFSAPGQSIYTTDRSGSDGWISGDYTFADGTSFASPYAAGVAALILSVNPSLTAVQVEEILQQSCVDRGTPGYDTTYGWGFVNAYQALTSISGPDVDPPEPDPMTFSSPPAAIGTTAVSMTATAATDATPPIQYMFQCTSATPGGTSSFWQVGESYTDTGLSANTPYSYRVAARDNRAIPNQTAFSSDAAVSTAIETPQGLAQGVVDLNSVQLFVLGSFTNLNQGQSGLYFDSLTPGGDTGLNVWVQGTSATATGLMPDTDYEFVVKARNRDGVETPLCEPITVHTPFIYGDCNNDGVMTVESDLDCIVDALLGFETAPPGGAHRIDINADEVTDGLDIQWILLCFDFGGC